MLPPTAEYLTVAELAARLAVQPQKTVRRMLADGMPHERPRPRLIRIPVARAESWIAGQSEHDRIALATRRGAGGCSARHPEHLSDHGLPHPPPRLAPQRRSPSRHVSLFARPEKRRWIMSTAPDWKQKTLPAEVVRPDAAVAYVVAFLRESGVNPGAEMERRKVEGPTVGECARQVDRVASKPTRGARLATLKGHCTHVARWLKPAFRLHADRSAGRAHAPHMAARAARREEERAHRSSTLSRRCAPSTAWRWPRDGSTLRRTFCGMTGVLAEMPDVEEDDPIRLLLATVQRLLDSAAVPLERRARYALAFTSGMRVTARSRSVRLDRLDRAQQTVRIEDAVSPRRREGPQFGGFAKPKAPKTKSSKRTLPLHRAIRN